MFQLVYKSLFATRGTSARLTPKRLGIILFLFPTYTLLEIANWLGFLLDEIFFRKYREVEVRGPVFIVGNARSGTTFLQRLLSKDEENFTSMKLWEIVFAPSITQKKFWMVLGRLDRGLGGPLAKQILRLENRWFASYGRMHKTSLFEHEEDEFILFHIFSSVWLVFVFPFEDDLRPFMRFDDELTRECRVRIMAFYKRCVQCHLFVFGRGRRFLSKNPAFSPKVESIGETFPDAKVVCMIRTPFKVLPSMFNMARQLYNSFTSPVEPYPVPEVFNSLITYWYRHPVEKLEEWVPNRKAILKYTDLVQNPEQTVVNLYERFGFDMHPQFRQTLREEAENARQFKSRHVYSLEQTGFTREQVISEYKDIFERFGFDTMDPEI
jgi:hypothetical protein